MLQRFVDLLSPALARELLRPAAKRLQCELVDPEAADCHEILDTVMRPLNELTEEDLCPGAEALATVNDSFR